MTEENPNQNQEVETKPETGGEAKEADELQDLFEDDKDVDTSKETSDERVARLEKKLEDVQKGVSKYFSEQGRKNKEVKEEEVQPEAPAKTETTVDDLSELFYAQTPQAEFVGDDLKQIADAKYGGSVLKAWRNEKWLQEKASSLESAKKEEEANKSKIDKPSTKVDFSQRDVTKIKPEELSKLSPAQQLEYLDKMAEQERRNEV
jgi:hypothetical protein